MSYAYNLVLDGQAVATDTTFDVIDPATGTTFTQPPTATTTQLDAAVDRARAAFPAWSTKSHGNRGTALSATADIMEDDAAILAELITREQGKPLGGLGSQWEIGGSIAWTRHTAGLSLPVEIIEDDDAAYVTLMREPLGVVGSITPWTFPILITIWISRPVTRPC